MKKLAIGIVSAAVIAPNFAVIANANTLDNKTEDFNGNSKISINIEKRSVVLGSKSKISVKFKDKQNADSITITYKCYDMELNSTLNYNKNTDAYEGTIDFNKDPQYLNVWKLESIKLNKDTNSKSNIGLGILNLKAKRGNGNSNAQSSTVLNDKELKNMGLNVKDYNVTQEVLLNGSKPKELKAYNLKTGVPIVKLAGADRFETAVQISKKSNPNGADKVIIVNGDDPVDGLTSTPLATMYNAPILLARKDSIPQSTKDEIKRLNPKQIVIVGGDKAVSEEAVDDLNSALKVDVNRIDGADRMQTSLNVAKQMEKENVKINKVYVANGYKDIDSMSIAPKAGEDKQPIILTDKNEIPADTYNYLKDKNLDTAYFIGGQDCMSSSVINQMSDITKKDAANDVTKHRIYGQDRHETNAKVMSYFYPQNKYNALFVSRSDDSVDALTAGPYAAKQKSPMLVTPNDYVSAYHKDNLSKKKADTVYQVGNTIKSNVISSISDSVSEHNTGDKTVVIDPGHGGADSGATSKLNGGSQEKNYTLNTSLATTEYLRKNGVNVVLTRDSDKTVALAQRTLLSNNTKPDLFTSIHFNAASGGAHGTEVYYQLKDKNGGKSKTAAQNILNNIVNTFGFTNRDIKTSSLTNGRDYLYVLRENKYPAILVECAFIDNKGDMDKLNSPDKIKKLGETIGNSIENSIK